jgi:hypothetical protein
VRRDVLQALRFELHGDRIVCMSGTKKEHREAVRALDEEIQKRKRTGCHIDIGEFPHPG